MQVEYRPNVGLDRPAASQPEGLVLADLLNDARTLAQLMVAELQRGGRLDAYLLAAGLCQVTEDWLHRDALSLGTVARLLRRSGRAGNSGVPLVLLLRAAALSARHLNHSERLAWRWHRDLASLVDELAAVIAGGPSTPTVTDRAEAVATGLDRLPGGLARSIVRLPSCFRTLDQRPQDCEELARRFARRRPDRGRPLLVIGLRTSGSYLAPLQTAYLRRLGYTVRVLTVRPGQDLLERERSVLRRARADRAQVLVCDDPPASGTALSEATAELERAGIPRQDLTLVVALLDPLPESLREYEAVTLPRDEWWIERLLEPAAVGDALGASQVERLPLDTRHDLKTDFGQRGHARALFRVTLADGAVRRIYAKGLGLGYLGHHVLAVTQSLAEYLPETLAIVDGVLFRRWLPEPCRLGPDASAVGPLLADRIAGYVADRARHLPAVADRGLELAGRQPLWQRISDRLGRGFGGVRPFVRPALHKFGRTVLAAPDPSVVDGSLALSEWFRCDERKDWLKVDYDERAFSNEDLHVYDAVWDLAIAAADAEMEGAGELAALLRDSFERRSGRTIDDVRWLLYRLQHLAGFAGSMRELLTTRPNHQQTAALAAHDAALAAAEGTLLEYLGDRLLGDIEAPRAGPVCAIDIDGVMETARLGFSSITPLGALALRALSCHGFRPVVVTGRRLSEVVARCRALRLAGGVAEYGAVVYEGHAGSQVELLGPAQETALERTRQTVVRQPGVHLDLRWERSVRAFRLDASGNRRSLTLPTVESVLAAAGGSVRAVPGWGQTDFVPAGVDKGFGLRALLELVAPEATTQVQPLALAVGDAEPDLPMLALAQRCWAPANAEAPLRRDGVTVARRSYQAGLAEAVASLIGHRPGGCPGCRPPRVPADDRLLLECLAAQDAGRWRRLAIGWRLYREVGR
jgi:hydroxymethylpyrimidine pyrophosphatase-like HAD family hydrolase